MKNELQIFNSQQRMMYWNDAVSKCRSSGMTVRDWCNREGINEKTYYYWQRKIFKAATKETEFVEIPNTGNMLSSGQIIATVSTNGFTVDIHQGADKESLTELLSAIKLC